MAGEEKSLLTTEEPIRYVGNKYEFEVQGKQIQFGKQEVLKTIQL